MLGRGQGLCQDGAGCSAAGAVVSLAQRGDAAVVFELTLEEAPGTVEANPRGVGGHIHMASSFGDGLPG